jgi:hypothetical protein
LVFLSSFLSELESFYQLQALRHDKLVSTKVFCAFQSIT